MSRTGVIGGSGLYRMEGITKVRSVKMNTPFGRPSGGLTIGVFQGKEVIFLPRHGKGHTISPGEINYRANIYAMKKLGVERIISVAACGSLKEEIKPLDFVAVDQFVDRTNSAREMSFFDRGIVAHIMFAYPVCAHLHKALCLAGAAAGVKIHEKGTYLNIEGPSFSTFAESSLYRGWGMDVIGMTNMAEARLAREAGICYASLAAVTDYDCWHKDYLNVSVEMVIANLHKNVENAKKIIFNAIGSLPEERKCSCGEALKNAICTDRKAVTPAVRKRVALLAGKYL
ncbi:MAG: S-methyl-5'-thioadenosine phosphorylase [Candidatus Omnitrophica bacterium]|nr:S-methyl-5'-thioadenosine phosphorylase [Candidatus Omnitrophota bacterium]MDD3983583.1 S-methyl-5'-thioadenosine phosphorylase [Candidatus Omnitrophota bacterium]